jgi:hypothetical protein
MTKRGDGMTAKEAFGVFIRAMGVYVGYQAYENLVFAAKLATENNLPGGSPIYSTGALSAATGLMNIVAALVLLKFANTITDWLYGKEPADKN